MLSQAKIMTFTANVLITIMENIASSK